MNHELQVHEVPHLFWMRNGSRSGHEGKLFPGTNHTRHSRAIQLCRNIVRRGHVDSGSTGSIPHILKNISRLGTQVPHCCFRIGEPSLDLRLTIASGGARGKCATRSDSSRPSPCT